MVFKKKHTKMITYLGNLSGKCLEVLGNTLTAFSMSKITSNEMFERKKCET